MKKVLITGGAGFIGSHLALELVRGGYIVSVFDNLSPQIHSTDPTRNSPLYNSILPFVNFIKGDVADKESLYQAISNNDIIVHYASETGTGQSMYEITKYNEVNISGTANLLDVLINRTHNVKKLIVASSRSIYGEGKYFSNKYGDVYPPTRKESDLKRGIFDLTYKEDQTIQLKATDEESKIHPSSFYAITKQVQEQMVMTLCPNIGIAPIALRYQNVYGPGQSLSNPYTGILSIFSNLILSGKQVNIFEDGKESRDFIYISDVIRATVLAINKNEANGHVFNVGSGVNTSVLDIAKLLFKYYGKSEDYQISGNYRLGDIRHNFADLTKISNILDFQPKITIEDGISKFCNWVITQPIIDNQYENSLAEMKEKGLLK